MGIKETKELLTFVLKLAKTVETSQKDGSFGVDDAMSLVSAMASSYGALNGMVLVPSELKDLSQDEVDEILKLVNDELGLTGKVEAITEAAIEVGISIFNLVTLIKEKS